jgi:hypothetical protein
MVVVMVLVGLIMPEQWRNGHLHPWQITYGRDKYGPVIADVPLLDGTNVNQEQAREYSPDWGQ